MNAAITGVAPGPLTRSSGAHQRELADLVADARVGELLDREHDVEVGRIGDAS